MNKIILKISFVNHISAGVVKLFANCHFYSAYSMPTQNKCTNLIEIIMQLFNENYGQEYFLRFFNLRPKRAARATKAKRKVQQQCLPLLSLFGFFALLAPLAFQCFKAKKRAGCSLQPAPDVMVRNIYYLLSNLTLRTTLPSFSTTRTYVPFAPSATCTVSPAAIVTALPATFWPAAVYTPTV